MMVLAFGEEERVLCVATSIGESYRSLLMLTVDDD